MDFIASGAQADVYKRGDKAIKLFKNNVTKSDIEYEKNLQNMAYAYGLPVPKVFDIIELDGKVGIVMECVEGLPLGKILMEENPKTEELFIKSIELQYEIHKIETDKFPSMKGKLTDFINAANDLSDTDREKILGKLENAKGGNKLCHGDFHVFNLIQTSHDIKIIDWVNATSGNPEADISRTYLIYKLFNEDIAELYLETYCKMYNKDKTAILFWLPILAAARLGEYVKDENERELLNEIIRKGV